MDLFWSKLPNGVVDWTSPEICRELSVPKDQVTKLLGTLEGQEQIGVRCKNNTPCCFLVELVSSKKGSN